MLRLLIYSLLWLAQSKALKFRDDASEARALAEREEARAKLCDEAAGRCELMLTELEKSGS